MIIVVTNRWTNTSKTYPAQSGLYARHLERLVNRYRNNLPKSFQDIDAAVSTVLMWMRASKNY